MKDNSHANRFQSIATAVANALKVSPTNKFFAGPDLASYDHRSTDWSITDLFQNTNFDSTGNIKLATDHWYRCSGSACSLPDVMNHAKMISNSAHIADAVKFFQSYKNGAVEYVLDEINILNGPANLTFSSSLATALYSVDFMMYCMTIGVKRVHWEQVYASNQALWQPSSSSSVPKQTRSGYYALIAAAEFIGNTGGNTKVAQITPQGNDGTTFSSYVAYNGNTPARVALLNLNYWDQSQGTSRPKPSVQVSGIPSGKSSVVVKYLTNPGGAAADASQTTFGGSQWPASNQGKEQTGVQNTTVNVTVSNGVAQIPVPYSSVAIVYL